RRTAAHHPHDDEQSTLGGHFPDRTVRDWVSGWLTSSIIARSNSATLQACATQPRGVCGASPSKISDTWPRQASYKWSLKFSSQVEANLRPRFLPNVFV